jgi:hypothetical protein
VFGLCVLIRPHLVVLAVASLLVLIVSRRGAAARLALAVPFVGVCLVGLACFTVAAGGVGPMVAAFTKHWGMHFGALHQADLAFSRSGLVRSIGWAPCAVAWLLLAGIGMVSLLRDPALRMQSRFLVVGALVPLTIVVYALSDPTHSRYFLPLLVLLVGCVARGAITLAGRFAPPVMLVLIAANLVLVIPHLARLRDERPPAVTAMRFALDEASRSGAVVVIDRNLVAFAQYEQARSRRPVTVLRDSQIAAGETPPPPSEFTIAVVGETKAHTIAADRRRRRFQCSDPLIERLRKDRFLDVTVSIGARLALDSG